MRSEETAPGAEQWHTTTWDEPDDISVWEIAGGGFITPDEWVRPDFMDMDGGMLFMYMFRRFGPSAWGSDPYKEIACWYLVTPNPDVILWVSPHPSGGYRSFGYGVNSGKYTNRRDPAQKAEVIVSLRAALEDLKAPVLLRDIAMNAFGLVDIEWPEDDETDPRLPAFKWAGYGVEPSYFDKYKE